jgi:hypothetical protein
MRAVLVTAGAYRLASAGLIGRRAAGTLYLRITSKPMSLRRCLLFVAVGTLLRAGVVFAASPAAAWERHLGGPIVGGIGAPFAIRALVDGSTMVVYSEPGPISVVRYGADGSTLSAVPIQVPYWVRDVAIDPFGALYVLAESSSGEDVRDFWTMKYDGITGKKLWPRGVVLDGPGEGHDSPRSIEVAPNGDAVVTGLTNDGREYRAVVLRYGRESGAVRWGPVSFGGSGRFASPYDTSFDRAGDVFVVGSDVPLSGGAEPGWTIVKYARDSGGELWKTTPVGVPSIPMVCPISCFTPYVAKLAFDPRGDVFLAVSSFRGQEQEWLTFKYDGRSGALLWGPVSFNGSAEGYESPYDVAVDAEGNLFVTGSASLAEDPWYDRAVVKYDGATGATLWGPVFVGSFGLSRGLGFVLDGFGNPVIVGATTASDRVEWNVLRLTGRTGAPLLLRQLLSEPANTGIAPGQPHLLALSRHGRIVVAGTPYYSSEYVAPTLAFTPSDGSRVWGPVNFTGVGRARTVPVSVLADSNGNVLTVSTETGGNEARGVVLKRDRETGEPLWGPVPFSPADRAFPAAAALDSRDDLFVVGRTWSDSDNRWMTVKYAGATGLVKWGPVPFEPAPNADQLAGLAVDARGDVIILADSATQTTVTWGIAKYEGSTGRKLWGPVHYDPPLLDYYARSADVHLALDRNGNVFLTASVRKGNERSDWATFKFDGATGSLLWGPVFLDSGYPSGFPTDLAVDRNGDVVVTGAASSATSLWSTIKYSGETGAVLWGPISDSANYGWPKDLAIDDRGDVFVAGGRERLHAVSGKITTVKYDGTTGARIWARTDGPGNFWAGGALQIAVSPAGNAILLVPPRDLGDGNWVLVGYAGPTGDVLWGPLPYDPEEAGRAVAMILSGSDIFVAGVQGSNTTTVRYTEALSIETLPHQVSSGYCGTAYRIPLSARNGVPPYVWSVAEGALPAGLNLLQSGEIAGEPLAEGSFPVTVRLADPAGSQAERAFTVEVFEGGERPNITVTPAPICPSGYSLGLDQSYTSYSWLPDGQTSPAIAVCPEEPSLYGVVATDARGCAHRASIELAPAPIPARQPILRPVRPRPPAVPRTR